MSGAHEVEAGLFRAAGHWLERLGSDTAKTAGRDTAHVPSTSLRHELVEPRAKARTYAGRPTTKDPIDVVTGEVVLRQVDVELPGILPVVLERTHVSSYRVGRLFGASWASTLDQRIEADRGGLCYASPDGMVLSYPPVQASGATVLPAEGPRWPLAPTPDGGYTVSDPRAGRTMHFASAGHGSFLLSAISDRSGARIDVERDAGGVPSLVRHSGGYRIAVDSDGAGHVTALRLLTDPAGPRGGAETADAAETTRMQHAGRVLVRYGYDRSGRLAEVVNSSGRPLRFSYDDAGRLAGWTDRNGGWYRYVYDELGRAVRGRGVNGLLDVTLDYADGATVMTDSLGHATTYRFNPLGQLVSRTDPLRRTTHLEWDRYDRLLSHTDAQGNTTRRGYDELGNLTWVDHPDGSRITAEYNDYCQVVRIVDADGGVWQKTYDERGAITAESDPSGATTRYAYTERGHLRSVADPRGGVVEVETDAAGLPVAVTGSRDDTTRYVRDVLGRVSKIIDPLGGVTRFAWTLEGALASRTLPDGAVERWAHDAEGNLVEHVDTAGRTTRREYTHFDRPAAEVRPDGTRLEFFYDTELRLTAVTGIGNAWRFDHDAVGNVVREIDLNGRSIVYAYDDADRLVARTNGAGEAVRFGYDALGRLIEKQAGDAVTTFAYDPVGRLTRAVGPDADLQIERDAAGRVTAEICNGLALTSAYDRAGNRVRRRTPSGAESRWEYDAAGLPVTLRTADRAVVFEHDAAGREIQRHIGTGAVLEQEWDRVHRLAGQQLLAGPARQTAPPGDVPADPLRPVYRRAYAYEPGGEVMAVGDTTFGDRGYELDPAGRVTAVHGPGRQPERYAYDALGNVTDAVWPVPPESWAADALGAREHVGTLVRRAGRVRYEHDSQGRMVLRQHARPSSKPLTWRYEWDAEDRLVGIRTPDGRRWRYAYDPLGRRIGKRALGQGGEDVVEQVDFVWDGDVLAERITRSGPRRDGDHRATAWDYEPGTFRPLAQRERGSAHDAGQDEIDERFYAIVTDNVGAPSELIDTDGQVAWRSGAVLWGGRFGVRPGTTECPLRFPGQYEDPESGLHYNYHRYYDPVAVTYLSPDPLGLLPQPNPHGYVRNPTGWVDPFGLAPEPCGEAGSRLVYGPFHRSGGVSGTQTPEVARLQQDSGEMWGRVPRHGFTETVQAYHGPLPEGEKGVEFYTFLRPYQMHGPMAQWYSHMEGVRVEDGFAKIDCIITKNTQI